MVEKSACCAISIMPVTGIELLLMEIYFNFTCYITFDMI